MGFNLSDVDLKLQFDANAAANISIFTFLVIPPFLLCLLCVLALVLAKKYEPKNLYSSYEHFSAEAFNWLSFFLMYLGWTACFINKEGTTCCYYKYINLAIVLQAELNGYNYNNIYSTRK